MIESSLLRIAFGPLSLRLVEKILDEPVPPAIPPRNHIILHSKKAILGEPSL